VAQSQKKSVQKITLSSSRDIPFDKLLLSQSNVRHVKAGVSIEELAEDIARRGLLMGLSVRAVIDEAGEETGMFEIPAGGRRYRALALLVKQRRLAKNAPVPCVVRTDGLAEEDSLAENIQRAPLHPLDQFRAFLALRAKGQSEEEIAANQFVSVAVVKQRLRLASVSPKLLDVYAEDGMTLDQLMAFTVNGDHERQEQVFERLCQSYDKQPYTIRRMLTEGAVRASDKRAQFIGVDAYVEAGGTVLNDLFQGDDGGWLQDVGLVEMMVAEKLNEASVTIGAEGWKWVEAAPDFAYGHTYGLRQIRGETVPFTPEEEATLAALQQEVDDIETASAEAEELTEEQDQRMGELETAIEALNDRPVVFDADEVVRAGAFVSIAADGSLRIERGYVRPEDELPVEPELTDDRLEEGEASAGDTGAEDDEPNGPGVVPAIEPEEDEGLRPIPDKLLTELTAHRTLALRHALGERPDVAFLAALHALALGVFYTYRSDTCLELDLKSVQFGSQAPGLNDTSLARAFDERHQSWRSALPKDSSDLWDALDAFDGDSRAALFAHCVSLSVNAVHEAWNRRPKAFAHADRLAQTVDLDMAASWSPTAANFLGRVTKARILQAVAEGRGQRAADRIEHLKKVEMATEAETLLAGSGWLPEPLRTPGRAIVTTIDGGEAEPAFDVDPVVEETAENGGELAMADDDAPADDEDVAEPTGEEEHAAPRESSIADGEATDDHDVAFEPHAIAAE
jgi:ParB family transcriptional regulator, chromosome partitioning protein